mmetsp:Transcript_33817/g.107932  ORF Transcript_33817/g.107932 Transcript_33817/m.107932 type:complete len:247 (-) Transcript_33817:223-963(-)
MGCSDSTPVAEPDALVAQTALEALFSTPTSAEATTLTSKEKRLDGMMKPATMLWSAGEQLVASVKVMNMNKDGMVTTIKDAGGNVIALLKHGDVKSYRRGTGRAVLYAPRPPAGASGHASMEGLHAAYEIRLPDDVMEAYPPKRDKGGNMYSRGVQKGGLGFFPAAADGAFSATLAYKLVALKQGMQDFVLRNNWNLMNSTGEIIGTYEDKSKKTIVAAAGVDVVLLVVYASVVYDYWSTGIDKAG